MSIALIIYFLRKRSLQHSKLLQVSACAMVMLCIVISTSTTNVHAQNTELADEEYRMAAGYYQQADWPQCANAFEEFIARYPSHQKISEANFFLAESKVQLGNYADSLVTFQKFVEQNLNHRLTPRATFRMGEAAYQLNKGKIALKSLELFVKKYPKHELVEYALPYLGELRIGFNEPALARRAFSTALRLYPDSILADQCRFGLANSLQRIGKRDLAIKYWTYIASQNSSKYNGLSKLQLGIVACEAKNFDEARPLLADAKAALSDNVERRIEASYWLGRIALESGNFDEANRIFTRLELLPSDENLGAGICHDAAIAAWKTGQNDLAIEWLTKLRSTWPNNQVAARAMALEINLLRERGLDVIALDFCNRFANRFPDDELRFSVAEIAGRIQHKQKKYAVGVSTFKKLLADHTAANDGNTATPESREQRTKWLYLKGLCHIGLEEFDTALQDLRLAEANQLSPTSHPQIKLSIATALFGQQFYAEAATEFESFLENADPKDRENALSALSRMVVCYGNLKRWEDADEAINVLFEGDRTTGLEATQFIADHANKNQRYDIATRYYQTLATPDNDPKFQNQGLAGLSWLMMETQSPEANEVFRRLLEEYPDSKFSSQAVISRARFLEDQDDEAGARILYRSLVDRFPNFELAQISRLRLAWFNQNEKDPESLQRAKSLIEQFLDIAGSTPRTEEAKSLTLVSEALYQLGWVNQDLGNTEQAENAFAELVAAHSDSKYWPDAAYRLADNLLKEGEYEHATGMIQRILNQETVPPEIKIQALYLQSKVAANGNRWDEIPVLMEELIANSDDAKVISTAKYWLAESKYRLGEFDHAAAILDELQPNATQLGASLEPWMLLRLAQCHGKAQRWTNSAMIARDCLDRFNDFGHTHEFLFLLGRAAEYDGMFDDSREHYRSVIGSPTGNETETAAIAQWRIGETHFHQKQHKEAIEAYFKAASNYTYDRWCSAALIQAGKCQEHLGNWKHAAKLYSQLVEQYPNSEFSGDANQRLIRVSDLTTQNTETKTR